LKKGASNIPSIPELSGHSDLYKKDLDAVSTSVFKSGIARQTDRFRGNELQVRRHEPARQAPEHGAFAAAAKSPRCE
jgi:hypothetical protein